MSPLTTEDHIWSFIVNFFPFSEPELVLKQILPQSQSKESDMHPLLLGSLPSWDEFICAVSALHLKPQWLRDAAPWWMRLFHEENLGNLGTTLPTLPMNKCHLGGSANPVHSGKIQYFMSLFYVRGSILSTSHDDCFWSLQRSYEELLLSFFDGVTGKLAQLPKSHRQCF